MVATTAVTALWTYSPGGPGYSKFYFQQIASSSARDAAAASVRTFFDAIKNFIHGSITISIKQDVQDLDVDTGDVTGSFGLTTVPAPVVGAVAAATAYAGGVGMCCRWHTGVYLDGRLVEGRTFLVPTLNCVEANGTLTTTAITAVQNAGLTFATQPTARPVVWHRKWDRTTTPPTQIAGTLLPIDRAIVSDQVSTLRSRRF